MTTVFKIKLKLIATSYILRYAYIYFCVMLIFKTKFISEQIEENRFGGLYEISDKFITKLNA